MKHLFRFFALFCASLLLVLTSCDSGGGMESEPDPNPSDVEATVEGVVTSPESDDPIDGADVTVFRTEEDEKLGQATTDSTGSYKVSFTVPEDDTPDQFAIEVEAEGFITEIDTVAFNSSLMRDFTLEAVVMDATASGEVTNEETGDGVEGAFVAGTSEDGTVLFEDTTSADGTYQKNFEIANEPSEITVEAEAEGFTTEEKTVSFSEEMTANLALTSKTESTVSGRVSDTSTDDPIGGATVQATNPDTGEELFETTTDPNGVYESAFEVVQEPAEISIVAEAEEYNSGEATVAFEEEVTADLDLDPEEIDVSVDGTVTDDGNGNAIEKATIEIFEADEGGMPFDSTTTASDGSFGLTFTVEAPRSPSELQIEARADSYKDGEAIVGFDSSVTRDLSLEREPIEITTIDELQKIGSDPDYPIDWKYVQTEDIDASETSSWNGGAGFAPIGDDIIPFTGIYNGNGFSIEGLTIERPDEEYVGLFGRVRGSGQLQNITLRNADIHGNTTVGGLVGSSYGTIQDSEVDGDIVSEGSVGGVVGSNGGLIQNVNATGNVEGGEPGSFSNVGGLVGINDGTIKSSESAAAVLGVDNNIGGLVGLNREATVESSKATGNVEGSGRHVGGLVGENEEGTIQTSKATGDVTADARWVGGLVGTNDGTIKSSESGGKVMGTGERVGGLIGSNGSIGDSGIVRSSFATGAVSGEGDQVGGLVGKNYDEVHSSFATGNVSGDGKSVGGLVGANVSESIITTSYATGEVSGKRSVGSLLGSNENNSEVDESYAVGPVSGTEDVGGLIGVNGANVSASFWDTEETGQDNGVGRGDADGTNGLTTKEMQGQSAQENMGIFDFEDTWQVVTNNYPALFWEDI